MSEGKRARNAEQPIPPAPGERRAAAPVGRGGGKLAAAVDVFRLYDKINGAHAVDVGASTGGFTQVLLQHGARRVLAVDVGHGQLADTLRRDPRVECLERTDWKTLSLSIAPGPFDFFTVDVSFVAARSMLRSLAFRLRDGAEGVVLVKPQFELPDRQARHARAEGVRAEESRIQALARFRDKAETLGFRLLAHHASPVPGGDGTVELLVHLRFDGRPDRLPRPGERRPGAVTKSGRRPAPAERQRSNGAVRETVRPALTLTDPAREWFLVVAPGAERVAARELETLAGVSADISTVAATPGGVTFRGSLEAAMRANLWLRIPTRILLRLGVTEAREFGKLRHQLARLPWETVLSPGTSIAVAATTRRCRLYHTGALAENVQAAIGDRLGTQPALTKPSQDAAAALILVRGEDDRFAISVDSSGDRLHRRGTGKDVGRAPIRETLASALLALADWTPTQPLYDPMCGSGTIPLEACAAALQLAPGLERSFAFEGWPAFDENARSRFSELRDVAARSREPSLRAPIAGSDRDQAAIGIAIQNAERAGLREHLQLFARPLAEAELPEGFDPGQTGLLLMNPPYGHRLGSRRDLPALYRDIGRLARSRFRGWRLAVVVHDATLASAFRLPVIASDRLAHGGLKVTLVQFRA